MQIGREKYYKMYVIITNKCARILSRNMKVNSYMVLLPIATCENNSEKYKTIHRYK